MIKISGLRKSFESVKAVDGLDFDCADGEMIALIGPNGSGKSTILRIVSGLMHADGGEVRIGDEVMSISAVELRKKVSYLPQRVEFPEQMTAKELLTFFARVRRVPVERASELLSTFGFDGFAKRKVGEFSGGMLQRLAMAIVFLPDADLYVLDEATNNLDADGLTRFREQTAAALQRGASIIMSTHSLREVENVAHKVAVVSNGRVVLVKRLDQFVEDVHRSRKMWITAANFSETYKDVALRMGAERVDLNCRMMTVECRENLRIPILWALSDAGALVKEFGLYEASLEDVYQEALGSGPGSGTHGTCVYVPDHE